MNILNILHFVTPPVIGGIIGALTNGIAIRMLFRPYKPVFWGKHQLPFTPGLIPKEKSRIANAIGKVIGANLLDAETLTGALASDKIKTALEHKIDTMIERMRTEEKTVQEYITQIGYEENVDHAVAYVGNHFGDFVAEKLVENQVGTEILDYALQELVQNLNPMFVVLAESAIEKSKIAILDKMDEVILAQCPGIIDEYLEKEYETWINKPVSEFAYTLWQKKEVIKEHVWDLYIMVLEKKAGGFVQKLDVAAIVEEKIQEFDERELEELIMEISRKELNSLVWIGGALGLLIGFVNLLV